MSEFLPSSCVSEVGRSVGVSECRSVGESECRSGGCGPSLDLEASILTLHPRNVFIGSYDPGVGVGRTWVGVSECRMTRRMMGGQNLWVIVSYDPGHSVV